MAPREESAVEARATEVYERPMLVEAGGFAELTLGLGPANCQDYLGGDAWFC
ncbi:lasso RiPP family leader peptide-containing protein [Streptomyces sp. 4N509B]|uniref:lasso RiPP family leader peptide-containing protein n=1 Tax=Streptomyces sp. 4N509B TaxID=3457413 RepID=UPI003FD1842D